MIPTKTSDITVTGNLNGDKIAMKFDENSLAHIMSVLTDLYSDPELAVIREYSTNAWDSHVAARNLAPIHVTLPSPLSPYFVVEDFGVGMSPDDIAEIYSKYGASTKRGTDEQVGMLGLGCKSALTYVSQFNVTAVKGGVKTQINVGRNEDGTGTMEVIDTSSTTAPNGVKITIPVKNANSFIKKANDFFKFWDGAQVLVNGEAPEASTRTKVAEGIFMDSNDTNDYVVMGNVAYPVESEHALYKQQNGYYYNRRFGVVAYVPIGAVNFTPARESLHYTNKTKDTLADIRTKFEAGYHAAIMAEIHAQPTHADAIKCRNKWEQVLGYNHGVLNKITYKGLEIPRQISIGGSGVFYRPSRYRYAVSSEGALGASDMDGTIIVTGFDVAQLTSTHKSKTKQWAQDNSVSYNIYVFVDKMFGGDWTSTMPTVDFSEIKSTALPKSQSTGTRYGASKAIPGSFNQILSDDSVVEVDGLLSTDDLVYLTPAQKKDWEYAGNFASLLGSDTKLLIVGENRLDKFRRDFPQAVHYRDRLVKMVAEAEAAITEEDRFYLTARTQDSSAIRSLDHTKINDPELAKLVETLGGKFDSSRVTRLQTLANITRYVYNVSVTMPQVGTMADPLKKYPLLKVWDQPKDYAAHATLYINAVYAAQNGDN